MPRTSANSVKIGEASKILGVSIDTLRRWEKNGKINVLRTPGGTRLYSIDSLKKLNLSQNIQSSFLTTEELLKKTESEGADNLLRKSFSESEKIETAAEVVVREIEKKESRINKTFISHFVFTSSLISFLVFIFSFGLIFSYLNLPNATKNQIQKSIALSPIKSFIGKTTSDILPSRVNKQALVPPNTSPPPEAQKQSDEDSSVLAVTSASRFLEINSDTQINGSLFVRDQINNISLEGTPSASTINLSSVSFSIRWTDRNSYLDSDSSKNNNLT